MFKKILRKFGYISLEEHNNIVGILSKENQRIKDENLILKATVSSYRDSEKKSVPLIDVFLGDTTPSDTEARKVYVSQVAAFFKDILEPKLKYMLSNLHNVLEERDSDRDFDLVLKGVAYAFRDLMRWGHAMINEHVDNQNTNIPEDDVEKIKEKLNNI